jgi:hypothetical protein
MGSLAGEVKGGSATFVKVCFISLHASVVGSADINKRANNSIYD